MSAQTSIQWTDRTWNPVRGCSRVSAGCDNCYAMGMAHRFSGAGKPFEGLTTIRRGKVDWTGTARFIPDQLAAPLSWRKPQRVFVNSMSDLFHESLTNAEIAAVFGVMAACPQHTFQVLTKRPKRAAEWFKWVVACCAEHRGCERDTLQHALYGYLPDDSSNYQGPRWQPKFFEQYDVHASDAGSSGANWPLPNVWLGVSAEDQETYNARVPTLVHQCPAAVHFVSLEPMLGPIKLRGTGHIHLDWVIIGGESGPGARPFASDWAESLIAECEESDIACFVKQLGGNHFAPWEVRWDERLDGSFDAFSLDRVGVKGTNLATVWRNGVWHTWDANGTGGENASEPTVEAAKREALAALQRQHIQPVKGWARHAHMLKDRKGGDMVEWPEALRVREFPRVLP